LRNSQQKIDQEKPDLINTSLSSSARPWNEGLCKQLVAAKKISYFIYHDKQ